MSIFRNIPSVLYANDWGEDYRPPAPVPDPVIDRTPFQTRYFDGVAMVTPVVPEAVFVI